MQRETRCYDELSSRICKEVETLKTVLLVMRRASLAQGLTAKSRDDPASGCAKNLPDGDPTTDYLSVFLSRPPVNRLTKSYFLIRPINSEDFLGDIAGKYLYVFI